VPDHAGARPHLLPHAVVPSRVAVVLPYIPLVLAGVAVLADLIRVRGTMSVQLGLGVGLVLLVVGRQFLALAENRRLLLELRDARDQLRQQALHDPLTGLANRSLFAERLQHALDPHGPRAPHIPRPGRAAARPSAGVAVLFCDLNDFKAVNDALGHGAGDELLRAVAQRLQAAAGPGHTVARLGGDEFAVLVDESADPLAVADRLVHAVGQPFVIDGVPVLVSVSVGVALAGDGSPEPRPTPDRWTRPSSDPARPLDPAVEQAARRLLQDADTAMYAAKAAGKGQVSVAPAR
jgi:diguanylate cyclase (GGDEF)-like protein